MDSFRSGADATGFESSPDVKVVIDQSLPNAPHRTLATGTRRNTPNGTSSLCQKRHCSTVQFLCHRSVNCVHRAPWSHGARRMVCAASTIVDG